MSHHLRVRLWLVSKHVTVDVTSLQYVHLAVLPTADGPPSTTPTGPTPRSRAPDRVQWAASSVTLGRLAGVVSASLAASRRRWRMCVLTDSPVMAKARCRVRREMFSSRARVAG